MSAIRTNSMWLHDRQAHRGRHDKPDLSETADRICRGLVHQLVGIRFRSPASRGSCRPPYRSTPGLEQSVDVEAVAFFSGDPARGGMRLGHEKPISSRSDTTLRMVAGLRLLARQPGQSPGTDWPPGSYVFSDQLAQNIPAAVAKLCWRFCLGMAKIRRIPIQYIAVHAAPSNAHCLGWRALRRFVTPVCYVKPAIPR